MIRYLSISALALAAAGTLAYVMTRPDAGPDAGPAETTGVQISAPMAANAQEAADLDTSTIVEMALGDAEAPVTVIEYASFTCPHCKAFHETTFPSLKADYIETGKVRFVHREVYFDRYGLWAGMVARCSGDTARYFGIADMIYAEQREWTRGEPADIVESLRRMGRTAGLTDAQLDACLSDGEKAQTLVAWYQENAAADGINSTPSFMIDGQRYSNMPYADFVEILDGKLGG